MCPFPLGELVPCGSLPLGLLVPENALQKGSIRGVEAGAEAFLPYRPPLRRCLVPVPKSTVSFMPSCLVEVKSFLPSKGSSPHKQALFCDL